MESRFKGVLCSVGLPSSKSPNGARGHRIRLDPKETRKVLHTLVGSPITASACFTRHQQNVVGTITQASIINRHIVVEGIVSLSAMADAPDDLGMSLDTENSFCPDMRAEVWTIHPRKFSGAAIILREKAAYGCSRFEVVKEEGQIK